MSFDTPTYYQNTKCIDITFVNVGSLTKRTEYPEFLSFMNKHSIVCMAETKCHPNLKIPGFELLHKSRENFSSGGICIAIKNDIFPHVKEVKTNSEYVLWIRIDKVLLNTQQDLIIGSFYVSPGNSPYRNPSAIF